MKITTNIFTKKLFDKQCDTEKSEIPVKSEKNQNRTNFIKSIRVNLPEKNKRKVEVRTCIGDGLGIQNKITS